MPQNVYQLRQRQVVAEPTPEQTIPAPDQVKPNAYTLVDGDVANRLFGWRPNHETDFPNKQAGPKVRPQRILLGR
jgi:hypothetical protein